MSQLSLCAVPRRPWCSGARTLSSVRPPWSTSCGCWRRLTALGRQLHTPVTWAEKSSLKQIKWLCETNIVFTHVAGTWTQTFLINWVKHSVFFHFSNLSVICFLFIRPCKRGDNINSAVTCNLGEPVEQNKHYCMLSLSVISYWSPAIRMPASPIWVAGSPCFSCTAYWFRSFKLIENRMLFCLMP